MKRGPRSELDRWVRRRRRQVWVEVLSAAAALALAVAALGWRAGGLSPLFAVAVGMGAGLALLGLRRRHLEVAPAEVAAHLDRVLPGLEESAALLIEPEEQPRPLLARLQRRRVSGALSAERRLLPRGPWLRAVLWWAVGLLVVAVSTGGPSAGRGGSARPAVPVGEKGAGGASVPPSLAGVEIEVRPPVYTGRPARRTDDLSVEVEEGAEVLWRVETAGEVDAAELVFDDDERLPLAAVAPRRYEGSLVAEESRLYWVRLAAGGEVDPFRSAFGRLSVIPDRAPEVVLVVPAARIEELEPTARVAPIRARARDEYGVARMELVVTLAAGSGELVEFRERRLPLGRTTGGPSQELEAGAELDLVALGVKPGSELYLVAEAWDGRRPEANLGRSDARILRMPGPRARSVDLGAGLPVVPLPEFFRSQRQIILDTEKLLEDLPRITEAEVTRRSEGLGFDQRALRMRYAGLLGEEFESGLPEDEEEGLEEWPEENRDDVSSALEALPEGFVHSHDWAEVNTYFDSRVRARLKEALREMWGAEGRLRSIEPRAALPFEYRALTALKAAQEAERVYVRKTGFEPPPLELERRLTGELDEVGSRRVERETGGERPAAELVQALAAARALSRDPEAVPEGFAALARAAAEGLQAAKGEPTDSDLELMARLRDWQAEPPTRVEPADAQRLEAALWRLLPSPAPPPTTGDDPRRPLWGAYRERLGGDG